MALPAPEGRRPEGRARSAGSKFELVACAGRGRWEQRPRRLLGTGLQTACLGHFKRKLASLIGGLRWKGPFQEELASKGNGNS